MNHFFKASAIIAFTAVCALLFACTMESEEKKEERIARQTCGSCHLFPDPKSLTKKIWKDRVLPEMAFRMGMGAFRLNPTGGGVDLGVIPAKPMVSPESFELIKKYFDRHAPDSLPQEKLFPTLPLKGFTVSEIRINQQPPQYCMIQADALNQRIFIGGRSSKLFVYDKKLSLRDSFALPTPPSHLIVENNNKVLISVMGIMDPNDERKGRIIEVDTQTHSVTTVIDSLKRPVYFEKSDLNDDKREDYIVCEFGNFTGALEVYEDAGMGKFVKHTVLGVPGARKVIVRDVDHDGKPDLVALFAQGNEQIVLFKNKGNFNFDMQPLLQFSPVYGSSYFEFLDYNGDGQDDILYTNGDNFDYSPIFKPYHGVHLFINEGNFKFNEYFFAPMNGASMAIARDFDGDGDLDIAALSYFPDFKRSPERGFMFFEKTGKTFTTHTTPFSMDARWIVMDSGDFDHDGDDDIMLAALDFPGGSGDQYERWVAKRTGMLVLRNTSKGQ